MEQVPLQHDISNSKSSPGELRCWYEPIMKYCHLWWLLTMMESPQKCCKFNDFTQIDICMLHELLRKCLLSARIVLHLFMMIFSMYWPIYARIIEFPIPMNHLPAFRIWQQAVLVDLPIPKMSFSITCIAKPVHHRSHTETQTSVAAPLKFEKRFHPPLYNGCNYSLVEDPMVIVHTHTKGQLCSKFFHVMIPSRTRWFCFSLLKLEIRGPSQ